MTLNELAAEFTAAYVAPRLRPSTARGYAVNLRCHILPRFGSREINTLTFHDLDDLTSALRPRLSNRSVVYVHATLRKMLAFAIKREYLTRNPYAGFDMPRVERYRYRTLTPDEIRRALIACKDTPLEIPVTLALNYGLRRGECLGLIPALDLDPVGHVLHVQRTRGAEHGKPVVTPCKTDHGDRLILLTEEHARLLYAYRNGGGYACPLSPHSLDIQFRAFLEAQALPPVRFHDLRHSYATFMLSKGVNPKIVCAVLGHSSVSVTLDIYSHPDVQMQRACLVAWDD